ncbi:hypothetical protein T484DRAFT_1862352 [Baffinella frigidus]|nr:hypothetical protein T484DRAFT_1862352 [Cryptophyta sp. CCMP2293]
MHQDGQPGAESGGTGGLFEVVSGGTDRMRTESGNRHCSSSQVSYGLPSPRAGGEPKKASEPPAKYGGMLGKIRASMASRGDDVPPLDAWRFPDPDVPSEVKRHNSRLADALLRGAKDILEPSFGPRPSRSSKDFFRGESLMRSANVVRGHPRKLLTGEEAAKEKYVGECSCRIINCELALINAELMVYIGAASVPRERPVGPNS